MVLLQKQKVELMATFSFDIDGHKVIAEVERFQAKINFAYRAKAKCPVCKTEYKAGYNAGDFKREGEIKSVLRSNLKRHYNAVHKGQGFNKQKRKSGW